MSRMYDSFCETIDSIYIAIEESGLSKEMFKQVVREQGTDATDYVILSLVVKKQFTNLPIFFNEALAHVTTEIINE